MDTIWDLSSVASQIRRSDLSSVDVTVAALDRIARYDGHLHSTLSVLEETAIEAARFADAETAAGRSRGPLHGIPIGIKDLLWTAGTPTTAGMEVLANNRADEDATVVTRLKNAGAVIIAKQAMTEGATFYHAPSSQHPINPWNPRYWSGVSSSGSGVAVAAGFCLGAIGSDTGGSIRLPCAANNLTGIKPTWGRVSRHGVIPLAESFDHLGPMAHSARDAAAILQVIAGHDVKDPTTLTAPVPDYLGQADAGVDGLTLGIDWTFATDGVDEQIVTSLDETRSHLEELGMRVTDVHVPWSESEFDECLVALGAEAALAHRSGLADDADKYSPALRRSLEQDASASASDVAQGYLSRERVRGRMRAMFDEVDVFLLPTMARLLPTWDEVESMRQGESTLARDLVRFTMPFNIAGNPSITLPAGFDSNTLPIGVQLAGPWLSEATLIRAGVGLQRRTEFHSHHPNLDSQHHIGSRPATSADERV